MASGNGVTPAALAVTMAPVVLRPLLLSRLGPLVFLVPLGYWAAFSAEAGDWSGAAVAIVALVPVGYFVVRAFLARVVCDQESVIVYGYLRTRDVPRTAVTGLKGGPWPRLRWRVDGGKARSTLVTPFAAGSISAPWMAEHNSRCLHRLARCIGDPSYGDQVGEAAGQGSPSSRP